jgi:hypothetical protein
MNLYQDCTSTVVGFSTRVAWVELQQQTRERVAEPMTDVSALPYAARRKFEGFEQKLADARAMLAAAYETRKILETRLGVQRAALEVLGPPGRRDERKAKKISEEINFIETDIAANVQERGRRFAEVGAADRVLTPLRMFVKGLWSPPNRGGESALRSVTTDPDVRNGETLPQAIERVRREIFSVKSEIGRLQAAPLTAAELREKITAEIDALARQGCPQLDTKTGNLTWADDAPSHSFGVPGGAPRALLCWLFHDEMLAAVTAGLDQEIAGSIPAAERPRREADLRQRLLQLEHEEEALIMRAPAAGHGVQRRADASPWAVLQIEVTSVEQQEAAA